MKIAAIIPARYQSSRFPGKPLAKIAGTPMIVHVYKRTKDAIDNVYVATDDVRIARECELQKIPVIMTSSLAKTGTDRVYEASCKLDADIIINIQGDEPLIQPDDIKLVLECKKKNMTDIVNAMCPISKEEDWLSRDVPKVVFSLSGHLLYMSRAPIPMTKEGRFIKAYKQVCIYAFTPEELEQFSNSPEKTPFEKIEDIEILRFLEQRKRVKMIQVSEQSIAVDRPEHIQEVEKYFIQK